MSFDSFQSSSDDFFLFNTTIDKSYDCYHFAYMIPQQSDESQETFSTSLSITDQFYQEMGDAPKIDKFPVSEDANSLKEYKEKLNKWRENVLKKCKNVSIPVPMSYSIPMPTLPMYISNEQWNDSIARRRIIRNFQAATSPLTSDNYLFVEKKLKDGDEINNNEILPNNGLNGDKVEAKNHLFIDPCWCSQLIPPRPSPRLYSTFLKYEVAMMKWAETIFDYRNLMVPSPEQVGDLINLKEVEKKDNFAPPPRPKDPINIPVNSINWKPDENKLVDKIKVLRNKYQEFQNNPPTGFEKISEVDSLMPPHSPFPSSKFILDNIQNYGVPVSPLSVNSTSLLMYEKSIFDVGLFTDQVVVQSGPLDPEKDINKIISILENEGAAKLILTDFSSTDFKKLLYHQLPNSTQKKTIGERIFEKITLSEIIKLSYITGVSRFWSKLALLIRYFVQFEKNHEQILQLDLVSLERSVELLLITGDHSFDLEDLPENELCSAIKEDPQREELIVSMSTDFRQAELISALSRIVLSGATQYIQFLPFLRELVHKTKSKISEHVQNDSVFPIVIDGYFSKESLTHNFYYRILRTVILLEYSSTIRVFAGHDLIRFMQKGLDSTDKIIKRHTMSLWQLMLHTDTSMALQLQVLQAPPSIVVGMINDASPLFQIFLLNIFQLFRVTKSMFDFRPFKFSQYNGYFTEFVKHINEDLIPTFLYTLLTLCITEEAIFCPNREEFNQMIYSFALNIITTFKEKPTITKIKCLKVLYKIKVLEPKSVYVFDLWDYILTEMSRKDEKVNPEYRMIAWRVFRNACLNHAHFMNFILGNQELMNKFDNAFTSLDDGVIACMICTIKDLAKPVSYNLNFSIDEIKRNNCNELFRHLKKKEVLFHGKILSAYKSYKGKKNMGSVYAYLVQFLLLCIDSPHDSILYRWCTKKHIYDTIKEVLQEVSSTHFRECPVPQQSD